MKFKLDPYSVDKFWAFYCLKDLFDNVLFYGACSSRDLLDLREARQSIKWHEHVPEGTRITLEILKICDSKKEAMNLKYIKLHALMIEKKTPPINLGVRSNNKKPVKRLEDSKRFESSKEAALAIGWTAVEMSDYLRGRKGLRAKDGFIYGFCD